MLLGVGKKNGLGRRLAILFAVLLIVPTCQLASSEDWPMFLHDPEHTGNTTSVAPNYNYTIWSVPAIGGNSRPSPVVANGRVFINRGGAGIIYALYENNGTEIWNQNIGTSGQVSSTPAVAGGLVYILGNKLHCFYENNGTKLWDKSVTGSGTGTSSPTVADGRVFFAPSELRCLYENNGTEIWRRSGAGDAYSSPAVAHGKVYVHTYDRIKCYYANNGTNIWNVLVGDGRGCSSPAVSSDGKVLIYGWSDDFGGVAYCLNASTGAVMWTYITGGEGYSSCAIANDRVFVNGGTVYCIGSPPYTIDYILIRDEYGGGGVDLCNPINYPSYPVGFASTFYGAAYNYSAPGDGYISQVPVISSWNSDNTSIADVSSPGSSSTITCSISNSGTVTITLNDGEGHENTTQVTVLEPSIDYIQIRDAPGGGGTNLCDPANYPAYPVGEITTIYGAAYNFTTGYIGAVDSTSIWDSSDPTTISVTNPGFSSTISCNATKWGNATITLDNGAGEMNSTLITVLEPTVDYIVIMTGPNGTGSWVGDTTFYYGSSTTYHAAGYNDTTGWIEDVNALWSSESPSIGNVSPGPSNKTTFYALNNGTCYITADYGGFSNTTGVLTVINYTVDYIIIRDSPDGGGEWVGNRTFSVGESAPFYAAAYNYSASGDGYIGDFNVEWECSDILIATVSSPGTSALFTSQFTGGECYLTARYSPLITNESGTLTVLPAELDYMVITDREDGTELTITYLNIDESRTIYASGYNSTGPTFVGLIEVDWTQFPSTIGSINPTQGNSTLFTAGMAGGTTTVKATSLIENFNDNFTVIINEPTVDYIRIKDVAFGLGNIVNTANYAVNDEDQFYTAAYNHTIDYLYDVAVEWSSSNINVGQVDSPGIWTNFSAQWVDIDRTCIVTATYNSFISNSTGSLTVIAPRVDYIQIRDTPGGDGNATTSAEFTLGEDDTETYYCAAFNLTVGYIGDASAQWTISSGIGTLSPQNGESTNFTATTEGTGIITANLTGITNSTGTITVIQLVIIIDLGIPTGLKVEQGAEEGSLQLSWNASTIIDNQGYNIYRSLQNGSGFQLVNTHAPVSGTTYLDTHLTVGTTYYYRVTVLDNASNESPPSLIAHNTPVAEEVEEGFEFLVLLLLVIIIILIVLLISMLILYKKRKKPRMIPFEPTVFKKVWIPSPSGMIDEEEMPSEEEQPTSIDEEEATPHEDETYSSEQEDVFPPPQD